MIISIASGKGGTGKTTIAVNLAVSLSEKYSVQLLDCDVEEPNCHIFLKSKIDVVTDVFSLIPFVNEDKCTYCGKCSEICEFNAIVNLKNTIMIFPELCHSCGGCAIFCPNNAITEIEKKVGILEIGSHNSLSFISGKLNVGEPMAVPVIREVKKAIDKDKINIIDCSPGTSCPVVSAVKGSDFCILVTEPTPFGLNDLKLAVELLQHLKIPFGVVLNQCDIGNGGVEKYCSLNSIDILLRLPFDQKIATAYSKGKLIIDELVEYKEKFVELCEKVITTKTI